MTTLHTYTPLQRKTRLKPVSKGKRSRVGKLGIPRLCGEDMKQLRSYQYERFAGLCQLKRDERCQVWMPKDGDVTRRAHLVHIRNKRMYGDSVENTTIGCYHCHIECDHNAGGKPCPSK